MRVAIDVHALGRGQAGYESYLRCLLAELPAAAPGFDFLLYDDLAASRAGRLFWDLPRRLLRDHPDVLHVQYVAPFPCMTPVVATIHDVSFIDVPHFFSPWERTLLRLAVGRTARMAARVVTVSEFSKQRLMAAYGLPAGRIAVAPNAAGPQFSAGPAAVGDPYILMVGDLQPRKNHLGAIRAFAAYTAANPAASLKLRFKIAGRNTEFAAQIRREAAASGAGSRIDFLGYVPDEELPGLYRGAACTVYPSFYEGFGLPLLESMASGTPVVTSRNSALQEVAGGAAVLADPSDPRDIRDALETALVNRTSLIEAGFRRARAFSWKHSAEITANAFREAAMQEPERSLVTASR